MTAVNRPKESVDVSLFDTSSNDKQYILTCEGRRWQINKLIYIIYKYIDGKRNVHEIYNEVTKESEEEVKYDDVDVIIKEFFAKRGLLEDTNDSIGSSMGTINKYLWCKVTLIKSGTIQKVKFISALFKRRAILVLFSIGVSIQLISYLRFINISDFFNILKFNSAYPFLIIILLYFAIFLHEFGHMGAFMKYGITPGNIGFGIYFTAPALYSDVSNAWKLTRLQRVLVDIGGMYFEFLYYTLLCLVGCILNQKAFVFAGFIGQIGIYRNLNPFLKFDGYWLVSDALGIPNLHIKVRTFFMSLVYRLFGIRTHSVVSDVKKREKKLFYSFAIFNIAYVLFFISGMSYLFFVVIDKIRSLISGFVLGGQNINNFSDFLSLAKVNFWYAILFVILIRIGITALKGGIKAVLTLVRDVRQQAMT